MVKVSRGKDAIERKEKKHETFRGEFRLGLAPMLINWHPQDMRQHTLSSSFIIHALIMSYGVTVELSQCF